MLLLLFAALFALPGASRRDAPSATQSNFAQIMVPMGHDAVCSCATCPVSHGGKCCCGGAKSTSEGVAFRAVCDTAPDAATPASPLPPATLPRRAPITGALLALCPRPAYLTVPPACFAPDAPLPPDAPPRRFS